MERPSITSASDAKTGRGGPMLLAVALSLLLHMGGVLAFVVLPWDSARERTVEVGGIEAVEVLVVSGPLAGAEAGSGTPDSEGEAPEETRRAPDPEPSPEPTPEPERTTEAPPVKEPEPEETAAPTPETEPLPVLTAEAPSAEPVPPPASRPPEVERRAAKDRAESEPDPQPAQAEPAAEDAAETQARVERPALEHSAHRERQLARLGAPDEPAESAGEGNSGAQGAGRQGAAPRAGNPAPDYPQRARRRGWEGRTLLEIEVDVEGRAARVRVVESSGYELLDRAAVEAVEGWRFTPARQGGEPEADALQVPIRFALQ